jgi:hypothetical protein
MPTSEDWNFFSINLMSVHDPAKFQQNSVIFAKSAAYCALLMADTVGFVSVGK